VVEDETPLREALCAALGKAGYAPEEAGDGTQALAALAAGPADLLLLDIGLPDVDGWEVLKRVRGDERTWGLPVLLLTGLEHIHADQAMAMGADEFLTKPVSPQVLTETVARLLARGPRSIADGEEGPEH
jgi:two-component system OmpR family response regulator